MTSALWFAIGALCGAVGVIAWIMIDIAREDRENAMRRMMADD